MTGTGVTKTTLRLYDNSGRVVNAGEYRNIFPGVLTLELPWLAPGYISLRPEELIPCSTPGTVIKIDPR